MKRVALLIAIIISGQCLMAQPDRDRLIVLADMGNEPDEVQQMLHLLMCSNEIHLEALIAVTGKHLRPSNHRPYRRAPHPELFHRLINGYEQVYPNLRLHADGWFTPFHLHSIVAVGQTGYGIEDVGEGKSSPGSQFIIRTVTMDDPRPVHIVINAGSNTLAQALYDYRAAHSPEDLKAFVAKIRVFENQSQDNAGAWICKEFPEIHWIRSSHQTRCYGGPTDTDLGPHQWAPFEYSTEGQDEWARKNVREGHGALGVMYPHRAFWGDELHFIEGGGTIPWMRLVSRGLTDPDEPSWGGWSGRYTAEKVLNVPSPYKDIAKDEESSQPFYTYTDYTGVEELWVDPQDGKVYEDVYAAIWPWRVAMWNDFKARMDWCVEPYENANHHPVAVLNGDKGDGIIRLNAKTGDAIELDASGSGDPDNDPLRYSWWVYPEAGRTPYGRELPIENADSESITLTIPSNAKGKEIHIILEVWDENDIVPLADYRRVVVTVE